MRRERPFTVDETLYPFADRWLDVQGATLHYVDEGPARAAGDARPVVLLHGNPTWSFLWRHPIRQLRRRARMIAPDLPGFGMSEHPEGYGYTPQEHAERIGAFVEALGLEGMVLVLHDWGGPIGLRVALERSDRVAGLVVANSFCGPLDRPARAFSALAGGRVGRWMHRRHNAFARWIVPLGTAQPQARQQAIRHAYTAPFPTEASRVGTWVFPRALRSEAAWLAELEGELERLNHLPVGLVWGRRDPVLGRRAWIHRWQRHFATTDVERRRDASHYVPEDAPESVTTTIEQLLGRL